MMNPNITENMKFTWNANNSLIMLLIIFISSMILESYLIEGMYGDGNGTVANSRYLFGESPFYFSYRGPLAAIALWPVEFFVKLFEIHPLNMTPYHIYASILHGVYLICCWIIVRTLYGSSSLAILLAFSSSILSVVFVAYSSYLSHDIIPGLLFLALIILVNKWLVKPSFLLFIGSVVLGAIAVLIKQTYTLFWLSIIIFLVIIFLLKIERNIVNFKSISLLFLMACMSALISWVGYSLFIYPDLPSVEWWLRPYLIIEMVMNQFSNDIVYHGSLANIFPRTLYFQNIHNYGLAAMILVLPGIYLALKEKKLFLSMVAGCWLTAFIVMLLIGAKEVRYLAFLAPLTLVLIIPVIKKIIRKKYYLYLLSLVVFFDFSRSLTLSIASISFAGEMQIQRFLSPIDGLIGTKHQLFVPNTLSFPYLSRSPFLKDRFHGVYHLSAPHIASFYEGKLNVVGELKNKKLNVATFQPGDQLLYANVPILREPPWQDDNQPNNISNLFQIAAEVVLLKLKKVGAGYLVVSPTNSLIMLLNEDLERSIGEITLVSKGVIDFKTAKTYFGDKFNLNEIETIALSISGRCFGNTCIYTDN